MLEKNIPSHNTVYKLLKLYRNTWNQLDMLYDMGIQKII